MLCSRRIFLANKRQGSWWIGKGAQIISRKGNLENRSIRTHLDLRNQEGTLTSNLSYLKYCGLRLDILDGFRYAEPQASGREMLSVMQMQASAASFVPSPLQRRIESRIESLDLRYDRPFQQASSRLFARSCCTLRTVSLPSSRIAASTSTHVRIVLRFMTTNHQDSQRTHECTIKKEFEI